MPLLDLAKITLNRTFLGVRCPACSGALEVDGSRESIYLRIFRRKNVGRIRYRCRSCRKRYALLPTDR